MIDGREMAPAAAQSDMYQDEKGQVIPGLSIDGPLAAGIPGTPAALVHLAEKYGRLPLKRSLTPAIRLAREGFAIGDHYHRLAGFRLAALRRSPAASAIFLDQDEIPAKDSVIYQRDLAQTLERLAAQGADGFYRGEVARKLVNGIRQAGGIWTLDDLANYKVVEREPVQGHYGNFDIISAAPPSSGGIALITMLNILGQYHLDQLDSATRKHVIIEAMRRAYRDRAEYLGDPDFVDIPVARLVSPVYAAGLAASIRLDRATPSELLPGYPTGKKAADTTHFSVLDRDGNRVAATMSVNYPFGSAFVPPGTGVLLNDEMDDFSSKPGVPNVYGLIGDTANAIAPGKRPLSSMTPTFLESPQKVAILGTPGGSRIITMVLLATLDFAADRPPDDWVRLPRFHHQFLPDIVTYEPDALSTEEQNALEQLGHRLKASSRLYGNMQAILWDKGKNRVFAASDPRGEGLAEVRR